MSETQRSGATLKRPVRIVKKRSGPLEDALEELHNVGDKSAIITVATAITQPTQPTQPSVGASPASGRRRPTIKEKKRERWLLTRKTWKYMTDAGRKLIPDSAQNRKEDIPKIEAHFQQLCAAEPRFILWRRKSSYPGATRNSKRRLKQLLQHTGHKAPLSQDAIELEAAHNADHVIELLSSYLKLDEACKTTTLLGSKTVRPDQTASPSAQRPGGSGSASATVGLRGPRFLASQRPPKGVQQLSEIEQLLERLSTLSRSANMHAITIPPEHITPALLEDKALLKQIYNTLKKQQLHRILSTDATPRARTNLKHSTSLSSLLHFGGSGSKHHRHDAHAAAIDKTTRPLTGLSAALASPLFTGATPKKSLRSVGPAAGYPVPAVRQRKPPSTLDLPVFSAGSCGMGQMIAVRAPHPDRQYNSCGTQTNFVPLHEIKRLAEEYKERKREEAATSGASTGGTPAATDDEAERNAVSGGYHHRRKSSIDNEDVSQSVSDTIKRYLRMARKKSVHDDNANRFKRVNYDRNLRNIRAKGEINPPGMDEGNCKAAQTLDAWPLITLDFIRGNEHSGILETAHAEWRRALDERIQKKLEYEQKLAAQSSSTVAGAAAAACVHHKQSVSSCSSSSAPTSPTSDQYGSNNTLLTPVTPPQSFTGGCSGGGGLRLAGSQFLSHLLYGSGGDQHDSTGGGTNHNLSHLLSFQKSHKGDSGAGSNNSANNANSNAAMQKSKSSSNVGQFVSRKILKNRSKSQTRAAAQAPLAKWAPSDKFTWTSDNGDRIVVLDTCLQNLTDVEAKVLQRVAIEKISELNIGVNVTVDHDSKSQKRRVLPKKKAMTTSFFDIGKKDEQSGGVGIFGNTLECCVANDHKRTQKTSSERGSRNSIASLFRSSGDSAAHKLNENVRSYESLPTSTFSLSSAASSSGGGELGRSGSAGKASHSGYFSNLAKSASMQISRSQSDVRRKSQDPNLTCFEMHVATSPLAKELHEISSSDLQVPSFVTSCIRYLEENGLHQVGLFRVSTSKKRVKQMREEFDKNAVTNIHADTCPHDVATLLKEFLRDLPEPLLCSGLYKAFLETQRIRNRRLQLEAISHLVKLLPAAHRDTLYVLLKFLAKVAACSDDVSNSHGILQMSGNKMDSNNLATVFAPNILRNKVKGGAGHGSEGSAGGSAEAANRSGEQESMSDAINVIRIMIDHYEEIFKVPAELVDIVYSYMLDVCPDKLYCLCEQRSLLGKEELGTSCCSLSSPEQVTSATGNASTGIATGAGSAVTPKRLYTRESVMHDNDASRVGPKTAMNGANGGKRYSDSHSNRNSGSDHPAMPAQSSRAQRLDERVVSALDAINRRQSSPNIMDKSGVVSASLQIPMPGPVSVAFPLPSPTHFKASTGDTSINDLDEVFYRGTAFAPITTLAAKAPLDSFQYSDIPYIEDAVGGQEILNECFSVSGSLSFTPKMEVALKERQPQQQLQQRGDNTTFRICKGSADVDRAITKLSGGGDLKWNAPSNEPKLPTSISSIGGAILRSKTADFERMSLKKQQQPQQLQQQQQLVDRNSHNSCGERGTATAAPATTTTIRTHLYKRQELIPSAKRSMSKK